MEEGQWDGFREKYTRMKRKKKMEQKKEKEKEKKKTV